MAIASGANVGISYIKEVSRGITPSSPAMKELRTTSRNINPVKADLQSNERRSNRQVQDFRHGFEQVNGSLGFELGMSDYDDMIEGAMGSAPVAGVSSGIASLAAVSATSRFTRAAGSFITDGFRQGDWITTTDMGQTAAYFMITAITATELTVSPTPVDHSAGGAETIAVQGRTFDIGSTLSTFTIERRFTDIAQYQPFRGCAINSMGLSVQPEQIVTATLDILGMSFGKLNATSLGAPTPATFTSPFSAFDGGLFVNGAEIAVVTGIDLNLQNGRALQPVVGQKNSPDVFEGTATITGTLNFLLQDASVIGYFEDESEIDLALRLDELGDAADFHALYLPRIKLNAGDIDPPQEGPVIANAPFQALYDATNDTTLRWQIANVS